MPWAQTRSKPRNPEKYGGKHQAERRDWAAIIKTHGAYCQQGLPGNGSSGTCIMPDRFIPPNTPSHAWALGHNDAGTSTIGPTHRRCNTRDGASRGALIANANRKRARQPPQRW